AAAEAPAARARDPQDGGPDRREGVHAGAARGLPEERPRESAARAGEGQAGARQARDNPPPRSRPGDARRREITGPLTPPVTTRQYDRTRDDTTSTVAVSFVKSVSRLEWYTTTVRGSRW